MTKNDRKIIDLVSGLEFEQNKMLKMLLKRSNLKRNEWHARAERLVNRSLGSPTKLSDIFKGTRSLPMRDIVPYIQALGMKKTETDYYIGEFFKAYCDENLHQYVSSRSKHQQILALEQRLRVQNFELRLLKRHIQRITHVDMPLAVYQERKRTEYKLYEELKIALQHKTGESFAENNKKNKDNYPKDKSYLSFEEFLEWERTPVPELNELDHESDYLEYANTLTDLQEESWLQAIILPMLQWYAILNIIKYSYEDKKLIKYISLYIPAEFFNFILKLDDDFSNYELPSFRTELEVLAELLSNFKNKHPEKFSIEYETRKYSLEKKKASNQVEPYKLDMKEIMRVHKDTRLFRDFISGEYEESLVYLPEDARFVRINTSDPDSVESIDSIFSEFNNYELQGLANSLSLSELFRIQNPYANLRHLEDLQLIDQLIDVIQRKCSYISSNLNIENPLNKYIKHPDYPSIFTSSYRRERKMSSIFSLHA